MMPVLPGGFHRIGTMDCWQVAAAPPTSRRARELPQVPVRSAQQDASEADKPAYCHDRATAAADAC